jgi:hypothetical protein
MGLVVRGWSNGKLRFEDRLEVAEMSEETVRAIAPQHVGLLERLSFPYMLELEFLDEPDPLQRFFRIGTDPRAMVKPMENEL